MQKVKFRIGGIKCNSCVLLIESRLENKPGILKVKANQESGLAVVVFDERKTNEDDILREIEEINNFRVERIKEVEKYDGAAANDYFSEGPEPISPGVESTSKSNFWPAAAALFVIIFVFIIAPKNNQPAQVSGVVANQIANQAQQNAQQPPQTAGSQQPQATTLAKSDNPILEAYVVSRCPYGLQMQRAMAEAVKNAPALGQYIKARYIGSVSGNTITAMHGTAEAQENLRQICIREEQPAKYWDYVSCQMKASGTEVSCEKSTGVDSAKLSACISDTKRGVAFAQEDFTIASQKGVSGSPTLILNGAEISESGYGGRSADGVRAMACAGFNSQPSFCSTKLTTAQAKASFSETY